MYTVTPSGGVVPLQPTPSLPLATDPETATAATVTTDPAATLATLVLVFIGIVFLCFFTVFARRFLTDTPRRHHYALRYLAAGSFRPLSATSGMDPCTIQALPVVSYNGKAAAAGCVVCLSEFEERERVKVIPSCRHLFHPGCIDQWLVGRGSCPVCRCSDLFGGQWRGGDVCLTVFGGGSEVERKVVGVRRSRSWCCREPGAAELRRSLSR